MITNLQYLGIYPYAIYAAIEASEKAVEIAGLGACGTEKLNECARQELEEIGSFEEITNSIIDCYFATASWLIKEAHPEWDVDFYVNCQDSHFYINGEEIRA